MLYISIILLIITIGDETFFLLEKKFHIKKLKTAQFMLRKIILEKQKILLLTTDNTITEIAYEVGFGSQSYFGKKFKETENISPNEFRHRHEKIHNHPFFRSSPSKVRKIQVILIAFSEHLIYFIFNI
ncbi:helix-turn-helix domain-containing protein [Candidatus Latescibacterota bacterium]